MNNKRISELLVETKAFKDLDKPVILASGELGIYYSNTEKLAQDNNEFEKYGDNSHDMIAHAIKMTKIHPTFGDVIDILCEDAKNLLPNLNKTNCAISGGQRRDWLFSGPVAYNLGIPHVSLYKNGQIEVVDPRGNAYSKHFLESRGFDILHFVDLLTEASSCYRLENNRPAGWIPMIRNEFLNINNLVAVVTRKQGGEQRLSDQKVNVEAKVAIDKDFLLDYSKQPEIAVSYFENPSLWSQNYLKENGALELLETFDPKNKKLDRAKKFLNRYNKTLDETGEFSELELAVKNRFGYDLRSLN